MDSQSGLRFSLVIIATGLGYKRADSSKKSFVTVRRCGDHDIHITIDTSDDLVKYHRSIAVNIHFKITTDLFIYPNNVTHNSFLSLVCLLNKNLNPS